MYVRGLDGSLWYSPVVFDCAGDTEMPVAAINALFTLLICRGMELSQSIGLARAGLVAMFIVILIISTQVQSHARRPAHLINTTT